jgi:hypothetical protein
MILVVLGCLALLVLVTVGRANRPVRIRREWRIVSAAASIAAFAGAAYLAIREAWIPAVVLLGLGVSLMGPARLNPRRRDAAAPASVREPMSAEEARSILGVGPDASRAEIQAAYRRLMERVHPDKGGAVGLATQLNAARDRLLKS